MSAEHDESSTQLWVGLLQTPPDILYLVLAWPGLGGYTLPPTPDIFVFSTRLAWAGYTLPSNLISIALWQPPVTISFSSYLILSIIIVQGNGDGHDHCPDEDHHSCPQYDSA